MTQMYDIFFRYVTTICVKIQRYFSLPCIFFRKLEFDIFSALNGVNKVGAIYGIRSREMEFSGIANQLKKWGKF